MPLSRQAVREAIARLADAVTGCARREQFKTFKLRPRPPARADQIERYERYLALTLPVTYRWFLELHNGYGHLVFPGDMLSIEEVMAGGARYNDIRDWKRLCSDYGSGEVLDGVVIASRGEPNDWVYLDPNKPTGET